MRLLIAEDDPRLLKSLVHIFEANHYAVDGVSDGGSAFDYASSGEYDGLMLDIMMPGTDGLPFSTFQSVARLIPALWSTSSTDNCLRSRANLICSPIVSNIIKA